MSEDPPDPLLEVADRLYAVPAGDFTLARNDEARRIKAEDTGLAKRVGSLRKPSVAAWTVNLLVRRESEQIAQVLGLGEQLRAAAEQLDGDELRALTRQRRQLIMALATTARSLAREAGVRLTAAVQDQVEGILNAAMLDPTAAAVVRSGLLVTAFTSTGVSDLDVDAVAAVPEALGFEASEVEGGEVVVAERPALQLVPDDGIRLAAAQEELEQSEAKVAKAQGALEKARTTLQELGARQLQVQGELEELQRRLADLEDEVEAVDVEADEAEQVRDEAEHLLEHAQEQRDGAAREVARLEG